MEYIIETRNLEKTYSVGNENSKTVLKSIDMSIGKGEFTAIMGPSGSGKSTLLYVMSGMDNPTGGTVRVEEEELSSLSGRRLTGLRLHRMGFIFQQMHLLKNLSIHDNIATPALLAKKKQRKEVFEWVHTLMKKTGIDELKNHGVTQVSGGQLQRAAICRALVNEPGILFGDEPTGALDSKSAGEVMDILTRIHVEGRTVVLVTHDPGVAARAQRVLFMKDGMIADDCTMGPYEPKEEGARMKMVSDRLVELENG